MDPIGKSENLTHRDGLQRVTSDCGPEGRGFEPRRSPLLFVGIARSPAFQLDLVYVGFVLSYSSRHLKCTLSERLCAPQIWAGRFSSMATCRQYRSLNSLMWFYPQVYLSHLNVTLHLVFRAVNLRCCAVEWMHPTLPALTALYPLM